MVFAYAAVSTAQKPRQPPKNLRFSGGQGSLSAFAYSGLHSLHQRRSAVGQVMAGLVAYGFSPSGGGRRAEGSEAPAPTPLFAGKNKGGFQMKTVYYLLTFSSFHICWVFGKNRLFANFSYFLTAIFKY